MLNSKSYSQTFTADSKVETKTNEVLCAPKKPRKSDSVNYDNTVNVFVEINQSQTPKFQTTVNIQNLNYSPFKAHKNKDSLRQQTQLVADSKVSAK